MNSKPNMIIQTTDMYRYR